jgi:hypothetical protein
MYTLGHFLCAPIRFVHLLELILCDPVFSVDIIVLPLCSVHFLEVNQTFSVQFNSEMHLNNVPCIGVRTYEWL